MTRNFMFLGVAVDVLTEPGAPVVVAEATLPEGSSPPLHVHDSLDDSFYVIEGKLVVRCGDDTFLATPGSWVQFPARTPHTFRVIDGPARVLLAQATNQFVDLVRSAGHPGNDGDPLSIVEEPPVEEMGKLFAEHGITNVGPPLEHDQAMALLATLR